MYLSETFLQPFKNKQPKWGPLGYYVFKRTYSRNGEEFWQTCQRVVEGIFSVIAKHAPELATPKEAENMYRRMFAFKFLPSGRSLWAMGVDGFEDLVAALYSCSFNTTKYIGTPVDKTRPIIEWPAVEPFCWMMRALMHGIGGASDVRGANALIIQEPSMRHFPFIIPDTREGWVASVAYLLAAFFYGEPLPKFSYNLIRAKGEPLKRFGGVSSGPKPLQELHEGITRLLKDNVTKSLSGALIADIYNMIGKCVVSGNIRRSAELLIGDLNDEEFINLKSDKDKVMDYRWASNNSILADEDTDFDKVVALNLQGTDLGLLFLNNARAFGRTGDYVFDDVIGFNACFSGDTLIAVADGRNAVTIKQLAEEGKDVPVYSLNPKTNEVEIKWARHPRITGDTEDLVRVYFNEGGHIDVTPNHKFILCTGEEVLAKNLLPGMNLPRFTKRTEKMSNKSKALYYRVITNLLTKEEPTEHRLIAQFYKGEEFNKKYDEAKQSGWHKGGIVIHHKDFNGLNNSPDNLAIMTFKAHCKLHAKLSCKGSKNGMYGKKHKASSKAIISAKAKERLSSTETRELLSLKTKNGMTEEVRAKISEARINYAYKNRVQQLDGLTWFELGGEIYVIKTCEACGNNFVVSYLRRERCICKSCVKSTVVDRNQSKAVERLNKQLAIYKQLERSLNRVPSRTEWECECKANDVSRVINFATSNSFNEIKERAEHFNHSVSKVEFISKGNTVYNLTVEDNHTVAIIIPKGDNVLTGIFSPQCGELPLSDKELCNLVSIIISNASSREDFLETCRVAYLYAKTLTLLPLGWPETDAVIRKNRRLGISLTGIADFIGAHGMDELVQWCDVGYHFIKGYDKQYSKTLGINESIKLTTIKPDGTLSLLTGSSSGIHYPFAPYYIRRVRTAANSPLVKEMQDAGYQTEVDLYSDDTVNILFPVKHKNYIPTPSIAEQFKLLATMQKVWADNAISMTLQYKPEEANDLATLLRTYSQVIKGISFFPARDEQYAQAPLEAISRRKYYEINKVGDVDIESDGEGERYCTKDSCLL